MLIDLTRRDCPSCYLAWYLLPEPIATVAPLPLMQRAHTGHTHQVVVSGGQQKQPDRMDARVSPGARGELERDRRGHVDIVDAVHQQRIQWWLHAARDRHQVAEGGGTRSPEPWRSLGRGRASAP